MIFLRKRTAAIAAPTRTLIINGNPDPRPERYCAALCQAIAEGAGDTGGKVRRLDIGRMALPPEPQVWASKSELPQAALAQALELFCWADRFFIVFPMWLGGAPPPLRLLFEELARQREPEIKLRGTLGVVEVEKNAHVIITASFPSLFYRGSAAAGMASFAGLRTACTTIIGSVDAIGQEERLRWLGRVGRVAALTDMALAA